MDTLKAGIIQELEEELVRILQRWFERNTTEEEDEENKERLMDLMKGADEVLSRWL
ncbi:MAG: hypothetical protein ACXABK_03470 [Candidatus Heimdallarchaeaceae archaeon]|jgi:hypothetical protein